MTTTIDQLTGQPLENGQPPGFYQRFNVQIINGKAYPWQAGQPADVAGMNAALAAQGQQPIEPASNQEVAQVADPNGPGNGEGGSDIGNILAGLSFVVGGSALAGALGASGMTAGQSLGNLANGFMNPSYGAVNSFDSGAMQNILDGGAADAPWGVNPAGTNLAGVSEADLAANIAGEDAGLGQVALSSSGQSYPQFLQSLTAAGVPAAAAATVASNVARGVTMTDALRMAGVAAPVIGALLSSGAIRDATGSQQQATDQAIDQITGGSQDATRTLNAAQLAGADTQRAALDEGLTGLQTQYDRGVAQQTGALDTARADLAPYREAGTGAINRLTDLLGTSGRTDAPNYGDLTKRFTLADFWDDPVTKASYQQGLDLGTKSLQNSAARSGMLNSGATMKALARFGIDYTGNQAAGSQARFVGDQNNTYNRLTGVANIGQNAVNTGVNAGMNVANNIANAGNLMATNAAQMRTGTATNIANSGNVAGTNAANIEVGRTNSIANLLSGMGNARGAAAIAQGNTLAGAGNTVANWWNSQDTLDKILNARRTA